MISDNTLNFYLKENGRIQMYHPIQIQSIFEKGYGSVLFKRYDMYDIDSFDIDAPFSERYNLDHSIIILEVEYVELMYLWKEGLGVVLERYDQTEIDRDQFWCLCLERMGRDCFCSRYMVFSHFREKGFFVKNGFKFGVDYTLYTDSPHKVHASFNIIISTKTNPISYTHLQALIRTTGEARKKLISCTITHPDNFEETTIETIQEHSVQEVLLSSLR
eukprot:TRINITY_DN8162_c0_g1_i1.p1 TRINITY_DN8162_c0_g1~~TRINITY_DN8162_c0_g1_i1.p1  ORF type:complete len:218 (+),score=31.15 TRINITY_DN8162_c0_g1_i1:65-718(+)